MQSNSEDKMILESYIPLMKFLAQLMPDTEFVLHDVSRLEKSIIAIENNQISGRSAGDPATDLVLRIMKRKEYEQKDYTPAYTSTNESGRFLNSGTFYIKNKDRLIGLFCVNTDQTALHKVTKAIDELIKSRTPEVEEHESPTNFDEKLRHSVNDIPVESVLTILKERDVEVNALTQEERQEIIAELNNRGVFLLKGAVTSIARVLHVSEATIYRYLRRIS
ncbi:helix-turn-helix transcriptional regulator [Pleomorphochaeta sp. DL1XJH-081]|uniref:helix-turn-helix transcriptional regulator n=1 Tax=Pleomorphochaeta sp. DL1XJH-081 TaxID=3409690 RepID=UPI003BB7371A